LAYQYFLGLSVLSIRVFELVSCKRYILKLAVNASLCLYTLAAMVRLMPWFISLQFVRLLCSDICRTVGVAFKVVSVALVVPIAAYLCAPFSPSCDARVQHANCSRKYRVSDANQVRLYWSAAVFPKVYLGACRSLRQDGLRPDHALDLVRQRTHAKPTERIQR
jgi:hypothetical protein